MRTALKYASEWSLCQRVLGFRCVQCCSRSPTRCAQVTLCSACLVAPACSSLLDHWRQEGTGRWLKVWFHFFCCQCFCEQLLSQHRWFDLLQHLFVYDSIGTCCKPWFSWAHHQAFGFDGIALCFQKLPCVFLNACSMARWIIAVEGWVSMLL